MAEQRQPSPIEVDEDWKSQVQAEDARLSDSSDDSSPRLPEASLLGLIQLLASQALAALGLIPGPDGESQVQLPIAKHFVDLLSVLETKCKGNLSSMEAKLLERTLHDLRMAYVEASKTAKRN